MKEEHQVISPGFAEFLVGLGHQLLEPLSGLGQVLALRGTWQPPWLLHLFSPGLLPQPPSPLQSFIPWQSWAGTVAQCACPRTRWSFPSSLVLAGVDAATDVRISEQSRGSVAGAGPSSFLSSVFLSLSLEPLQPTIAPVKSPPRAARPGGLDRVD